MEILLVNCVILLTNVLILCANVFLCTRDKVRKARKQEECVENSLIAQQESEEERKELEKQKKMLEGMMAILNYDGTAGKE